MVPIYRKARIPSLKSLLETFDLRVSDQFGDHLKGREIEESYPGEILGFKRSKAKSRCILCNKDTSYSAFLARRL